MSSQGTPKRTFYWLAIWSGFSVFLIVGSQILGWNNGLFIWSFLGVRLLGELGAIVFSIFLMLRIRSYEIERVMENVYDGIVVVNRAGRVLSANSIALSLIGASLKSLQSQTHTQPFWVWAGSRIQGYNTEIPGQEFQDALQSGNSISPLMVQWMQSDGTTHLIEISLVAINPRHKREATAIFTLRDVSEMHSLHVEQLKHQKLEALSIIAGGVVHDFNNLLQVVTGNLELLGYRQPQVPAQPEFRQALSGLTHARMLIRQLATFSSVGFTTVLQPTDGLIDLLREVVEMGTRGTSVHCRWDYPDPVWPVAIDRDQMHQVFLNLTLNAVQAMPSGGTLEIVVDELSDPAQLPPQLTHTSYLSILFRDEGTGIVEEHVPHLFDPYFTTKKDGKGFGLATAFRIVQRHGGTITVTSKWGEGAEFTVYLPRTGLPVPPALAYSTAPQPPGQLLIMDDEPAVRKVISSMATHLGYTVIEAENGRQVLDMLEWGHLKPDAMMLLDVSIPNGMGGIEIGKIIRDQYPSATLIVMSGYANPEDFQDFRRHGFDRAIAKPFNHERLSKILQNPH